MNDKNFSEFHIHVLLNNQKCNNEKVHVCKQKFGTLLCLNSALFCNVGKLEEMVNYPGGIQGTIENVT